MRVLFCADPLGGRRPDPAYEGEIAAAAELGIAYDLVDFDALTRADDPTRAVRWVAPQADETIAVYRGWMLRPAHYTQLYEALLARSVRLINDPVMYCHTHYLPESYAAIEGTTPRSVWLPIKPNVDLDLDAVMDRLAPFGDRPVLLKDYVKSRKHEWAEACFIPAASDHAAVERVVRRFLELQGDDLNEGLVFREFVDLAPLGAHARSGMPLAEEYRLFYLDGQPICLAAYWEDVDYPRAQPPLDTFNALAARVQSRFFTMDVARRRDGDWLIVELGDGQVAGLPDAADPSAFYAALQTA